MDALSFICDMLSRGGARPEDEEKKEQRSENTVQWSSEEVRLVRSFFKVSYLWSPFVQSEE